MHEEEYALSDGSLCLVRNATDADIAAIYKLIHSNLSSSHSRKLNNVVQQFSSPIPTEDDLLKAFHDNAFEALVVIKSCRFVGMAIYQNLYRAWTGNSLYLQDLIVEVDYRGGGIGTLLLKILTNMALNMGCDRIAWESLSDNKKACKFYSDTIGAGFVPEVLSWKLKGRDRLATLAAKASHHVVLNDGISCTIRNADEGDIPAIYKLSKSLASMCGRPVVSTEADFLQAFRRHAFEVHVVIQGDAIIGMALYQLSYRTLSGSSIYLQNLIVDVEQRGAGLGTLLFHVLAKTALEKGCNLIFWESLKDDEKACKFYAETIRADPHPELHKWRLMGDRFVSLAGQATLQS
jgi:diamine N-acetyltransferase